eukprot:4665246-Lingulodinium_polyedra.AAC.1
MLTWSLVRGRTPAAKWSTKMRDAAAMLVVAMDLVARQVSSSRYLVFEHPATAKSWAKEAVQNVAALTGARI